jgi:hypothetical protein
VPDVSNSYKRFVFAYWRIFNALARFGGYIALVIGTILTLYFLPVLLNPDAIIDVDGIPTADVVFKLLAVGFPALVALLGFFMTRVKPYYPSSVRGLVDDEQANDT